MANANQPTALIATQSHRAASPTAQQRRSHTILAQPRGRPIERETFANAA